MLNYRRKVSALAAAAACALAVTALAQEVKLPSTLTVTSYDRGSSGYNIAVAVGNAFKSEHGTKMRVIPAGNDVARLTPLRRAQGKKHAEASMMGVGAYFAQEGVLEFAVKQWGPQPLRLILANSDCSSVTLGVAKDSGVKEVKDLRGKRVGMVRGSPALNEDALAVLAFGGLTKDDVKLVQFNSYDAMWKGVLNNKVDAAITASTSGQAKKVETSARGLMYPPTPASDIEGWVRINKIGPWYTPHMTTCGTGMSAQNPVELPNYPYPIFLVYASQPESLVYSIAKSMIVNYDRYKDGAPGLELKRQIFSWVLPYHEGAVKAFKESGVWTAEHEAHNQGLIKRQEILAAAWNAYLKSSPPNNAEAFRNGWMGARFAALKAANLDVIFEHTGRNSPARAPSG
jgi:TRAP transporter TAXI family solute receptor